MKKPTLRFRREIVDGRDAERHSPTQLLVVTPADLDNVVKSL
jgi:hypothetical protein